MTENEGFTSSVPDVTPKPARAPASPETVAVIKAMAAARDAGELWCLPLDEQKPPKTVVEMALEFDPDNADRWVRLENQIGTPAVVRIFEGGARAVGNLGAVEKAVAAELARSKRTAAWLASGPLNAAELGAGGRLPMLTYNDESWLPGGVVGLVVAGGGSGKTTWLAELAVRISHGIAWPDGLWAVSKACGPVLAVLAEEDRDGVAYQLRRACKAAGVQHANDVHIWAGAGQDTALGVLVTLEDPARGRTTTVVPTALHDALCERARALGPLLVVLDPVNQLLPTGGSENDAITAAALIRLAGEIQAAAEEGRKGKGGPRPVVLIAHHERKMAGDDAGADATRGSTAFVDNARWVCRVTARGNHDGTKSTEWAVVKSNYTAAQTVKAHRSHAESGIVWAKWTEEHQRAIEAEAAADLAAKAEAAKQASNARAAALAKPAKGGKGAKAAAETEPMKGW